MQAPNGILYLIPTTLGDNEPLEVLPLSVKKVIEATNHFIVENEKSARRFIKKITPKKVQPLLELYVLNKYTQDQELPAFLEAIHQGKNVGLLSEAGCPGVADPGSEIVKIAHERGIRVVPLVGPSSILMAMMASGMNGQNFAFNGYLPIDKDERKRAIKQLEKRAKDLDQSQAFIETPYRNDKLMADLTSTLSGNTRLCVACDITLATEYIKTLTINEWKKTSVSLHKRPTMFVIDK
ncbi:ribosomal RNA small subunit methyltransferase I [Kordia sp. SMS9]|uniref:SAM-dependent methyltransferase n=1 Tax=Kordia sp. SMS9 TaxID=2282170 RepID=UPI000E0CC364|nr:SAM-dependent methyltransferase [Kordia sp. SMS9]AXG70914.1 ribosomal RNA small subunit methyltransferase I [Kordia sp. SMS9]